MQIVNQISKVGIIIRVQLKALVIVLGVPIMDRTLILLLHVSRTHSMMRAVTQNSARDLLIICAMPCLEK